MPRTIHNEDEDDTIVRDGERYRVPIYMMDAMQRSVAGVGFHDGMGNVSGHKPGYCFSDDKEQEEARAKAWEQRSEFLRTAWMNPSINQPAGLKPFEPLPPITRRETVADPAKAAEEAWLARGAYLKEAWRGTGA